MKEDAQIAALANLVARNHSCCRCEKPATSFQYGAFFCSDECAERVSDYTLDSGQQCVPDFNSLDVMHEAEKVLFNTHEQVGCSVFREQLTKVCGNHHFFAIHSTAAQRREALLRTLDLWKESK